MYEYYREKGVPENVELVTSGVTTLPFEDDHLDGIFSTMIYHEFTNPNTIREIVRVLAPGGHVVLADW